MTHRLRAGLAAGTLVGVLLCPVRPAAVPAMAEGRTMLSAHAGPIGFGVDVEQEGRAGGSWIAGISLAPTGVYGGVRQYSTTAAAHRPFYGAYLGLASPWRSDFDSASAGMWLVGGYEVRFDRQLRGTGEIGFGLHNYGNRLVSDMFIGLSLGIRI